MQIRLLTDPSVPFSVFKIYLAVGDFSILDRHLWHDHPAAMQPVLPAGVIQVGDLMLFQFKEEQICRCSCLHRSKLLLPDQLCRAQNGRPP